jgi:hypothetical protein
VLIAALTCTKFELFNRPAIVVPLEEENNDTFTDCMAQSSVTILSFVTIMIHFLWYRPASCAHQQ